MRPIVVGIAGGTASGKSTFSKILVEELKEYRVEHINTDNYFRKDLPRSRAPLTQKEYKDYNIPEALDLERFIADLNCKLDSADAIDVLIVEGLMVLYIEDIRNKMDLKLFVELDADERMYRRIKRNMQSMGISIDEIADYYLESVKYREMQYALFSKIYADIILNGNNLGGKVKDVISYWIKNMIDSRSNIDF